MTGSAQTSDCLFLVSPLTCGGGQHSRYLILFCDTRLTSGTRQFVVRKVQSGVPLCTGGSKALSHSYGSHHLHFSPGSCLGTAFLHLSALAILSFHLSFLFRKYILAYLSNIQHNFQSSNPGYLISSADHA